jgi:signal transduction histidine kinase
VGASAGTLYLYDPDRDSFRLRADDGANEPEHNRDTVCGEQLIGCLLDGDQDVVTAWCGDRDPGGPSHTPPAEKACIAVRWRGQLLGALVVHAPGAFSGADLDVLRRFAEHAATALRNARVVRSLQDINDLKDAVIGVAAHDLRGPLTHLTGYLELLIGALGPLDGRRATWLRIIEESVERMGDLIDGILRYRRLGPDSRRERQECCLNKLVAEVVADSETSAAERSQELDLETTPHEVTVTGDPVLLREAIRNVVSNAVKYTPARGRVSVRTSLSNTTCVVTVEDTGPGIPQEERERVFRPFVRLASARDQEGLGLGLSLVKTIIEQHGGRVTLGDAAHGGSVFTIVLPAIEEPAP